METTTRELGRPYREPRRVRGRGFGEIDGVLDLEEWTKDTALHQCHLPEMSTESMLLPVWRSGQCPWLIPWIDASVLRASCESSEEGSGHGYPGVIEPAVVGSRRAIDLQQCCYHRAFTPVAMAMGS